MLCYVEGRFETCPYFLYLSDVCNKKAGLKPAPTDFVFLGCINNKGQV